MNTMGNIAAVLAVGTIALSVAAQPAIGRRPPVIKHDPVTIAVRGQPVTIRAVVTTETGAVKTARLHYSVSRDVAPFTAAMTAAGGGSYFATIPATIMESASEVTYYVDATDDADGTAETPWHKIRVQGPATNATSVAEPPPASAKRAAWVKPALWAGGAALVAGGVVALSGGGGGGGDGGGGSSGTTNTGTYAGTVTTTLEMQNGTPVASSHAVTFTIVSSGIVSSDNLQTGQHLEAPLRGSDFTMVAPVSSGGLTGSINYYGSLLNSRIVGSVSGSVSSNGTPGSVTGSFSATRQ